MTQDTEAIGTSGESIRLREPLAPPAPVKTRDSYFDNLKAVLIFLMVFGHLLEFAKGRRGNVEIYSIIYSFHMPVFVMVSGYFSKNIEKARDNAFQNLFIPYLIFNFLFSVIMHGNLISSPFVPAFALWYLLALFVWRLLLKSVLQVRWILLFSVLLSLFAGLIPGIGSFMALSRIISFFPYFLAGYFFTDAMREKVKRIPLTIAVSGFVVLGGLVVYLFTIVGFPFRTFFLHYHYEHDLMGLHNTKGLLLRLFTYILTPFISLFFIRLIPKKKLFFTSLGQHTFPVLVFHYYLVYILHNSKQFLNYSNRINPYLFMLCCLPIAVVICLLTGNRYINMALNKFLELVGKVLFKTAKKTPEEKKAENG